jgi:hypothetical protein
LVSIGSDPQAFARVPRPPAIFPRHAEAHDDHSFATLSEIIFQQAGIFCGIMKVPFGVTRLTNE